jgi:hypothetical protein
MTVTTDLRSEPIDAVAVLVDRYIALWNDPDRSSRIDAIRAIWAPNGSQILQAPEDLLGRARQFGFATATLQVRGYDELEHRVARSYAEFCSSGAHRFELRDPGVRLGDLVMFSWTMIATASGDAVGGGTQVWLLDGDGRVLTDHQFIDR